MTRIPSVTAGNRTPNQVICYKCAAVWIDQYNRIFPNVAVERQIRSEIYPAVGASRKNRASGFRSLAPFADLVFLTIGDLDIPAHIPSDLRTL